MLIGAVSLLVQEKSEGRITGNVWIAKSVRFAWIAKSVGFARIIRNVYSVLLEYIVVISNSLTMTMKTMTMKDKALKQH